MKLHLFAVVVVVFVFAAPSKSEDEPSYEDLKKIATGPAHEGEVHERFKDHPPAQDWELTGYAISDGKRIEVPKLEVRGFYTKGGTHLVYSANRPGEEAAIYTITTFAPEEDQYLHWILQPPNIVIKATGVYDKAKREMTWTTSFGTFSSVSKETWDGEKVTSTEVYMNDGKVTTERHMVAVPIEKDP